MQRQPRILVIDDEVAARYGLVRDLSNVGYLLEEAEDGGAALAKIEAFRPDVIVSDIKMPGTDGLSLLKRVNQAPDPPMVVLITAYGSEDIAIQALRAGAHNYLSKPFEVEELRLIVASALDKHRLLRENRRYYRELERTLAELKESQTALVQTEKMASLGKLVASVAHEVNNPLGALQSSVNTMGLVASKISEWCQGQPSDVSGRVHALVETLRDVSAQAQASCERLRAVVSNLRQFAQLDRAEFQRADVHAGIESTLHLLRHAFGDRIDVDTEFGDLPEINCWPRELNQVFMNLLLNAKEAIERTGGRGSIRVRTSGRGDPVRIEISDNGCGIPAEHLDKIFDPRFTIKGVQVGTGLGLTICYQTVRAYKGAIEVSSQPGEGTTFTVTLPSNLVE